MVFNLLTYETGHNAEAKLSKYRSLQYRQHVVAVCTDFYEGRQVDYLYDDILARNPNQIDQYYFACLPLTKLVIDDISLINRAEHIRRVKGTTNDEKLWEQDMKAMQWVNKMQDAEKMVNLSGSPMIAVHWASEKKKDKIVLDPSLPDLRGEKGHPILNIMTYDTYDVRLGDQLQVTELLYPVQQGKFNGFSNNGQINPHSIDIVYWSEDIHYRGHGNDGEDRINPYHIIPAVVFHRSELKRYFWNPCDESLIYNNELINLLITIGGFVGRYQTASQPVKEDGRPLNQMQKKMGQYPSDELGGAVGQVINSEIYINDNGKDSNAVADQAGAVRLGPADLVYGKFRYENAAPNLDMLGNWVERKLKWIAATHNLDPDRFVKQVQGPQSGASIWATEVRAEQAAKHMRAQMANNEKRLFEVVKAVRKAHAPSSEQYSEDCELEIIYKDNETPLSPQEKFDYLMSQYDKGFLGPVEVVQQLNPYMTYEEAKSKYTKTQNEREQYKVDTSSSSSDDNVDNEDKETR